MKESLLDKIKRGFGRVLVGIAFVVVAGCVIGIGVMFRVSMIDQTEILGMCFAGGMMGLLTVWISYVANLSLVGNKFGSNYHLSELEKNKKAAIITLLETSVCVLVLLTGVFQEEWYAPFIMIGCLLIPAGILALIINDSNVKMEK